MHESKKAQAYFEFLVIIGALLLIYIIFVLIGANKQTELNNVQEKVNLNKECMRLSNMVSNVYSNGAGTEINTKTNYILTVYNDTMISIKKLKDSNQTPVKAAVLLSEAGTSNQDFYDKVEQKIHPDWFKICFKDKCAGSKCDDCQIIDSNSSDHPTVNWNLIPKYLPDLMANIDNYNTIYMEDAHLHTFSKYSEKSYIDILKEWLSKGNVLIISEHFYCRTLGGGAANDDLLQECTSGDIYNEDVWELFNFTLYEKTGTKELKVVYVTDPYTLKLNQIFSVREYSFVVPNSTNTIKTEAESLTLSDDFEVDSGNNCRCDIPSNNQCIKTQTGRSQNFMSNASFIFDRPSGIYDITTRFCLENNAGDGDIWNLSVNSLQVANWMVESKEGNFRQWIDKVTKNVAINNGDEIRFGCQRSGNSFCVMDYFASGSPSKETVIAIYTNTFRYGILFWPYGSGIVHYLPDFQIDSGMTQTEYTDNIVNLIKKSYLLINPKYTKDETYCTFYGKSPYHQVTGNITIINENSTINIIEN